MNRYIYILLSLLLLLQAGGALLCCQVHQMYVRWQQHDVVEHRAHASERFVISANTWRKCRQGNDEVLLNGILYDVVSITRCDSMLTINAIRDDKESKILGTINVLLAGGGHTAPLPDVVVSILDVTYLLPDVCQIAVLHWLRKGKFPIYQETLRHWVSDVLYLPPEQSYTYTL